MENHTKYLFHPQLEIFRCGGGVFMSYVMGNKISLFEESIDEDFSSFIAKHLKSQSAFSVTDMINFFSPAGKKYNFGKILQKFEQKGLLNEVDGSNGKQKQERSILFINLTDIPDKDMLNISEEVGLPAPLAWINGLKQTKDKESLYKRIEEQEIKDNQVIFVISDFHYKYKVSELNVYFFKKGIFWCPVIIDDFGGYIGPLIHSVPSGPCFECYNRRMYIPNQAPDAVKKTPVLLNMFLRVVFLEALKVKTNISPSQIMYSNLLEIDCWNYRSRKHYIYPDSNCEVCGV